MSSSKKPLSIATRLSSEARQTQIIETVIALAAQHSPGQITTQEIANVIGVTQGALFRHFPNKEAVLATLQRFNEDLTVLQQAIRRGDADKLEDWFTRTRAIRRSIIEQGQDDAAPDFGRKH